MPNATNPHSADIHTVFDAMRLPNETVGSQSGTP